LAGGPTIADPFRPTATLVRLLELRAARLRTLARRRARLRHADALLQPALP